ncbi:B- and T-lymphocyte attenuator-like isoform X1 [Melanotaenia boesemani]|uniref:B- and T-lymphocyte attenuator-like isoform X1 n=1 Tax=Melanotaenia boesemani TaxID=1250792 RepID=UPI001C05B732|nr:B- and T-lymphocyte attenuator-like isoform X1 [Melanotaenia boesemani]
MRPNHCWTAFHVSVLAVLSLTVNADTLEDSECAAVEVRRHTAYNVSRGQELRIICPFTFCNDTPPKVSWNKIEGSLPFNLSKKGRIKTEWKMLEQFKGEAYLIFKNILYDDAGVYRCELPGNVGHGITVYVSDQDESSSVTQISDTTKKESPNPDKVQENILIYVYCAAGITSFVIIVIIISIIAMKGCKGKSNKEAKSENHYMSMPMVEQPVNLRLSPRASPHVPPSRRSTQRKLPSRPPDELRSSREDEELYNQTEEDRNRLRQEEESGSVVYAALNHELPQRLPARRPRPVEEQSEYAAIRVK